MTWLFENPWPLLFFGGITLAIIAGGWLQTQRRELIYAFVAAVLVFGGLLALERIVVTEREELQATIEQIAREAEANNVEAMVRHIHSGAPGLKEHLRSRMALVDISKVSVKNNLKAEFSGGEANRKAVTSFNVVVTASDRAGLIKDQPFPRFIEVTFQKEDGQWRCVDFKDSEPQGGLQLPSAN